ncbi:MAG: FAD-binding protein, partial [Anaerolineae bacterium]|nr:FAD-binding protein [Anaerolineae bacterium]
MHQEQATVTDQAGFKHTIPLTFVHTLVIGSGAAGLGAAAQLRLNGIEDILIVTEGLHMGTSINTGSDKQTYYKLSLCGADGDSPSELAETYFAGGSMHGDIALAEAANSTRAFVNLVNLGLPFPRDKYGQFVGYRTDHDPRQRATSIGPYTSREMCRALIQQVRSLGITIRENLNIVQLLTIDEGNDRHVTRRIVGAIAVDKHGKFHAFGSENVVFAVGGPGGLYEASVYPTVHTGAIGLALMAGARAQNLPESQYGLASTKFRWNVSGTYMQAIPRFISTDPDGLSDGQEFMTEYFGSAGELNSLVFLKGYQWPFDAHKVSGGSSVIDILVTIETVLKGRRVFLDYRHNPIGFAFSDLTAEARQYLEKSQALLPTPIARLRKMNPAAFALYREHGIDIMTEPLEIAVCAQHNNGGLAGNLWWESVNIRHLFPVGEVNGTHGVYRPGGSALNAGQVGALRAAEYIANRCAEWSIPAARVRQAATAAVTDTLQWIERCSSAERSWQSERAEFRKRMTRFGAHIRSKATARHAARDASEQWQRIERYGCTYTTTSELTEALRNRQLCCAHAVYLDAIRCTLEAGVGSRGSAIVLDENGAPIRSDLGDNWRIALENPAFRQKILETDVQDDGTIT